MEDENRQSYSTIFVTLKISGKTVENLSCPYFNHVKVTIQCNKLFRNEEFDRGHGEARASKEIPKELLQEFTMNGRLKIQKWYFDRKYIGGKARTPMWSKDDIDDRLI